MEEEERKCPLCQGKHCVSVLMHHTRLDKDDPESFSRSEVLFKISGSGLAGAEYQAADVHLSWFPCDREHYDRREPVRDELVGSLRFCPCCGDELRNDLSDNYHPPRD